ncbi:MAG TPA: bifunctional demethylmenaquinone methyltransferase/2-methoxy-6-polyprenyl-1,4-benzoquinol methylase UbiE [Bacteroidales bacterium]|nr:bifunctional demethylmenaquinone methyltransferase/2-methoxy-6-polyprenyl-1,4-benzoquinol methylase UbiE [Bacteroidales bacterium]HPO64463.1 bifunctional demethylmenaquinone methyltransferase/2-methoxy-6-polyprenyl-1,4-benzoquinol methylase UbiE [Bacteroidales bacterium]
MTTRSKKERVRGMFNAIAHQYDFLNHFLSLGIDYYWRKKAIKQLSFNPPSAILDVATGTADVAIMAARYFPGCNIVGIDISEKMLNIGQQKVARRNLSSRISLQLADSENMPFANNTFDAVMSAFGVRNFENLDSGLAEMFRVLKPGGKVVILEFSQPTLFPFRQIYRFYFHKILPFIGRTISRDKRAYTYLPESVEIFPFGNNFLHLLENAGFKQCKYYPLTLGIATIYVGTKE